VLFFVPLIEVLLYSPYSWRGFLSGFTGSAR
jgi:hypothetical protein